MLARSFMKAEALGISEVERDALIKTLNALERGEVDGFDMRQFTHTCGTPACICGWANHLSGGEAFREIASFAASSLLDRRLPKALVRDLFLVNNTDRLSREQQQDPKIAAQALSSYLTTGKAEWVVESPLSVSWRLCQS